MEHKLIRGGELYLPFARSRIKAMKATGLKYASQQFVMPDGATVHVQVTPGHDYIGLTGAAEEGYQFFTTGPTVQKRGDFSLGYSLKVTAVPDKGNPGAFRLKAKALASTLEADVPTPERAARWRLLPDANDITAAFPLKHVWQIQGVIEHQYFPRDELPRYSSGVASYPMMVDSWSHTSPILSLDSRGSLRSFPPDNLDITFDVRPSVYRRGRSSPTAGRYTDSPEEHSLGAGAPDSDWYKRAAFATVTHPEFGKRVFCVMSDISDKFHVYPANADLSIAQRQEASVTWPRQNALGNILEDLVQRAAAPLPAWCRADAEEARVTYEREMAANNEDWVKEYLTRKPQHLWAFNSTCTKACAVVFEDIAGIPRAPNNAVPKRPTDGRDIEESLPGLVEMGLHIAITGPNPEDFTFSMTLDRELRATVTKEYVMAADYAWIVKDGDTPVTALDDLILLTGAIYHTSEERQRIPSANNVILDIAVLKGTVTVRNHTQGKDIRTFLVADTNRFYAGTRINPTYFEPQATRPLDCFEALGTIISYDLRILAFVVQQRLLVSTYPDGAQPGKSPFAHFAFTAVQRVLVYAYNALVEETLMDPDSPLNARLADVFADTSHESLFRYPVDDVGEYRRGATLWEGTPGESDHVYTAYRNMGIFKMRYPAHNIARYEYEYGPLDIDFSQYGGSINAGPFLYSRSIAATLRPGAYDCFSVHPNGSWAVSSMPIYYYSGSGLDLALRPRPGTYDVPLHGADPYEMDPALMKQMMVDIINLRVTSKDGTVQDVRGTHLDMVNEAFGKDWTAQRFLCDFSLVEELSDHPVYGPGTYVRRRLVASTRSPGVTDYFDVFHGEGDPNRYPVRYCNPAYIDSRQGAEYEPRNAYQDGPVLRGASLFY